MTLYRKKPVVIEAIEFFDDPSTLESLHGFCGHHLGEIYRENGKPSEISIKTLEDGAYGQVKHIATEGDFIIKGVNGEFYACKPDIFWKTYERE